MSKQKIIDNMILYIENAERDLQATAFANESKVARTDIVNAILNELEREIKNEN